jgi:diadenosine tetraphosphate (Ap4A) HIT family hydrolase
MIKEFQYWTLFLHQDQRYLGRSYIWLRRPGKMQSLFHLHPQEEFEKVRIGARFESATTELWQPDHWNYAWLGNDIDAHGGHGHMHLIPRYKERRVFAKNVFFDGRWKQNYSPYAPLAISKSVLYKIRDALRNAF